MDFTIQPLPFSKFATRMKIDVTVILDKKAIVRVSFFEQGAEYEPLNSFVFYVEGDEYKAWGSDDTYIKNLVYSKMDIKPELYVLSEPQIEPQIEPQPEEIIIDA